MTKPDPATEELIQTIDYFVELSNFLRMHVPEEVQQSPAFKAGERGILRAFDRRSAHLPDHEPEVRAKEADPLSDTQVYARSLIRMARQTRRER